MDNDLVNVAWFLYLSAALGTVMYLDGHAHTEDLGRSARFGIQFVIVLCGMLFWITWPLIGLRRLKQVRRR